MSSKSLLCKRSDGEWSFGDDRSEQTLQDVDRILVSNQEHSSHFKGVTFDKKSGKWQMKLAIARFKIFHEQLFSNEVEAAKHYDHLVWSNFNSMGHQIFWK